MDPIFRGSIRSTFGMYIGRFTGDSSSVVDMILALYADPNIHYMRTGEFLSAITMSPSLKALTNCEVFMWWATIITCVNVLTSYLNYRHGQSWVMGEMGRGAYYGVMAVKMRDRWRTERVCWCW